MITGSRTTPETRRKMSDAAFRRHARDRVTPKLHPPKLEIEPMPQEHEQVGDPAHGEKVRRCRTCGRPAIGLTLFDFGLVLYGRLVGSYRLCEDCYRVGNPIDPRDGDPLDATAA